MRRTFNSTGRKRIPQSLVTIRLIDHGAQQPRSFVARFSDLGQLALPPDAKIYVEPRAGSSSERFAFGTIAQTITPLDTRLAELDEGAPVLFRIKVVDESSDIGKILASTDGIAPRDRDDADGRKSLLPIRHTDLGEELWRLDVNRDSGPQLLVNNRVPGLGDRVVSDVSIQGMVLPAVIQSVFREIFEVDDELDWVKDWKRYACDLLGEEIDWEIDPEEQEDDAEALVGRIGKRFVEAKRYASLLRAMQGEYADG